ncbi:outer membrane beta-barrel protein [Helicobacter suis]|uniref:outer membrane beta-barrel protein n=1 Tax=Helicobacter suis TaxID=104628 RepID=UPI000680DDB5|nr:outer membrane beta-barrel protein [Helicobacter suis]
MNETNKLPGEHASMNTSYFQLPINLGFRTNFTKHQGLELGLRIPLVTNYYYKAVVDRGTKRVLTQLSSNAISQFT